VYGDVHFDTSSDKSPSLPNQVRSKKWTKRAVSYARENTAKFVFGVAVGLCVIALATLLGLDSSGGASKTSTIAQKPKIHISPYGNRTAVSFTAENSDRAGVWALKSPVMTSFSGRRERPVNAARWLDNGTEVPVRCARAGTYYELKLAGRLTRWQFFAELENGTYVPMAGFSQTTQDGAQGLIPCDGGSNP